MAQTVNEIIASHTNSINRMTEQKSRHVKKLTDLQADIKAGMKSGSIMLLDWARDVKFYLESDIDSNVNYESMLKEYKEYVEELINYIAENQQNDASTVELQRMVNELGKKVKLLNSELHKQDEELANYKINQSKKTYYKPIPEPTKPEPEQEDDYPEIDESETEAPPKPVIESSEEQPEEEGDVNQPLEPLLEGSSETEQTEELPQPERAPKPDKTVYVTDATIAHIKLTDTKNFEIGKAEADKMRKAHIFFTDYSTVEHRYYKAVMPSFKVRPYTFDLTAENMCRVCKKSINVNQTVCSEDCRRINRRFRSWIERYERLLAVDNDLTPVISREKKAEHMKKTRKSRYEKK